MFKSCSPYLKIFYRKGINWHYFLSTQLQKKAENEDKLIFLHIGYISNIIVRESSMELFSDPEVKQLLNNNFISILEDKDDKPESFLLALDLLFLNHDFSYGPANMFITPDRMPLIAFSDCNPRTFVQIATSLLQAKSRHRGKLNELANALSEQTINTGIITNFNTSEALTDKLLQKYIDNWFETMFQKGFLLKISPFTPNPSSINLIIEYLSYKPDDIYAAKIEEYLYHLQHSGILDVIDGGFFRQAEDYSCSVVYYEKTLEENCRFLLLFASAYSLFGKESYRETAYLIYNFIKNEMQGSEGALINSTTIIGDFENIDYYSFSLNELKILFPDNYLYIAQSLGFNIDADKMTKQFPSKGLETLRTMDAYSLSSLKNRRKEHKGYFKDTRIVTSSNCAAISCMTIASAYLQDKEMLSYAIKTYDFIISSNINPHSKKLYRYTCSKERYLKGYMSDYALYIEATLMIYNTNQDYQYLRSAISYTKLVLNEFYKKENGMFSKSELNSTYDTVPLKREPNTDIIRPSANSVMAGNLINLYLITKNKDYLLIAKQQLNNIAPNILTSGPMLSGWAHKLLLYLKSGLDNISE